MNSWMNEWMHEFDWMVEWMNKWMNESMKERRMNKRMNEWMNEWMHDWMNECKQASLFHLCFFLCLFLCIFLCPRHLVLSPRLQAPLDSLPSDMPLRFGSYDGRLSGYMPALGVSFASSSASFLRQNNMMAFSHCLVLLYSSFRVVLLIASWTWSWEARKSPVHA